VIFTSIVFSLCVTKRADLDGQLSGFLVDVRCRQP